MNEIYTGHGYRNYFKQKIPMDVPGIITREQYEKANEVLNSNGTRKCGWRTSAANIFSKMVYDKDNGIELMTSNWKYGDNKKYYIYKKQFRYITNEYVKNKLMFPYDKMLEYIKEQVLMERAIAIYVVKKLDENDYAEDMQGVLSAEKIKAKQLFEIMTGTASEYYRAVKECDIRTQDECLENLESTNKVYEEIAHKTDKVMKAFGKNNPWIKKYRCAEIIRLILSRRVLLIPDISLLRQIARKLICMRI